MTPERWNQVCSLLTEAVRRDPAEWSLLLKTKIEDPEVRSELERILRPFAATDPTPTQVPPGGDPKSNIAPAEVRSTLPDPDSRASKADLGPDPGRTAPGPTAREGLESTASENSDCRSHAQQALDSLNLAERRELARLLLEATGPELRSTDPQVRCPRCGNPIAGAELPDDREIVCPCCGHHFRLEQALSEPELLAREEPRIGRYILIARVGGGTYGTVYKARDPRLGRIVALKLLRAGEFATEEQRSRFEREASSVAGLRHPLIVPVHDAGTDADVPYIVSQFVEGVTLADWLNDRRPTFREAARLVADLAEALHYAHENGVVHRDVKPSNIMIDADGQPHVMDFGMAKRDAAEVTMTMDGDVLGTPAYMSPEQARGDAHHVSGKTDVYSLGVILYELLTGERPFRGNVRMLIQQVLMEDPRAPRTLVDTIPRDLDTICLKAMAKEPSARYATGLELAADLNRFMNHEPIQARPIGRWTKVVMWARRNPRVAALSAAVYLLLVALAAGGASAFLQISSARTSARSQRVRLNLQNGVRLVQNGMTAAALPWMVEALKVEEQTQPRQDAHRARIASLLRQSPRPIMSWALDGPIQAVEFDREGKKVLLAGGSEVRLCEPISGQSITKSLRTAATDEDSGPCRLAVLCCNGTRVLTVFGKEARLWNAATGEPSSAPFSHDARVESASLSADGKLLATSSGNRVHLWDTSTGRQVQDPLTHADLVRHVVFSPNGRRLLSCFGGPDGALGGALVWEIPASQARLVHRLAHEDDVYHGDFSPDGKLIITSSYDQTSKLWDAQTGQVVAVGSHPALVLESRFSPDGTRLASVSQHEARIWSAASKIFGKQTLRHDGDVLRAVWSADGAWLATCGADRLARVWDAHTGEPVFPPIGHNANVTCAAFSPDGRYLLTGAADGSARLWDLSAGNWPLRKLRHGMWVGHGELGPDGKYALSISRDGHCRIWDLDQEAPLVVIDHTHRGDHAAFSPDGQLVATVGYDRAVRVWNAKSGELVAGPLMHEPTTQRLFLYPDEKMHVVRFDPVGRSLLSYCSQEAVVWDWRGGGRLRTIRLEGEHRFRHIAYSPDGRHILASTSDGAASLWPVAAEQGPGPVFPHEGIVYAAFDRDGGRVVTSGGRSARVWDAKLGTSITELNHRDQVNHAEFSPDGSMVVTASNDRTAGIWNAETGKLLVPILSHDEHVISACFSKDSRLVATGSGGEGPGQVGAARVWDALTGDFVSMPLRHGTGVRDISFNGDGRLLLTAAYRDSTARIWDLSPAAQPIGRLAQLARLFSGTAIDETGGQSAVSPLELCRDQQVLRLSDSADFSASKAEVLAWRESEAESLEGAHDWPALIACSTILLGERPGEPHYLEARGLAYAELEQWEKAKADLTRAVEAGSEGLNTWTNAAVICLWTGDPARYKQVCEQLLDRFGQIRDTWRSNGLAAICALGEQSPSRLDVALALVERVLKANPRNPEFHTTFGALLFRRGRFKAAIQELNASIRLNGNGGTITDWLYLSLAHDRMDQKPEARRWLEKAEAKIQADQSSWASHPQRRLESLSYLILRDEARKRPLPEELH